MGEAHPLLDAAKVRATINQIKISIESIRTTKTDPNSTKVFCEGALKFTVPTEILSEAEKTRELVKGRKLSQDAQALNFENSADTFSKGINYSVQPTDDGAKVFVEVENYKTFGSMLERIVGSALVKPLIEEKANADAKVKADQAAEQTRLQAENEKQQTEQKKAALGLAKTENAIATQQINEIWKSLTEPKRNEILEYQRAWIKKKAIDCKVAAAGKTIDPIEKESYRLTCDSEATKIRTAQLKQYLQH